MSRRKKRIRQNTNRNAAKRGESVGTKMRTGRISAAAKAARSRADHASSKTLVELSKDAANGDVSDNTLQRIANLSTKAEHLAIPNLSLEDLPQRKVLPGEYHLLKEQKVLFSMDMAQKVLAMKVYEQERIFRERHGRTLRATMEAGGGCFNWDIVIIMAAYVGDDQTLYRVNGQHTAWSRLYADDKMEDPKVKFQVYRCADYEGLRRLYSTIDLGAGRTHRDQLHSLLYGRPEFVVDGTPIPKAILQSVVNAIGLWQYPKKHVRKELTPETRAFMALEEYADQVRVIATFLSNTPKKSNSFLHTEGPLAAMHETLFQASNVAMWWEFWEGVREGIGDRKGDSRPALMKKLLTETEKRRSNLKGAIKLSSELTYRWCIRAWNAYFQGKPLTSYWPAQVRGDRTAAQTRRSPKKAGV